MIEHLSISGLGVIDHAELDLTGGFNVVTGETGAGKTMVVTAFGLLLGHRASPMAVRKGAERASVDAELEVPAGHPARSRAAEAGVLDEDAADDAAAAEPFLLGRAVTAKGRSRASAVGRAVPVGVLGEIGEQLVTVHGQADQLRLKSPAAQREALDAYAGAEFAEALRAYQEGFARYQQLCAELEEITAHELERRREAEHLQQALEQIDEAEPQPGEDERLKSESVRLGNLESLRDAARTAQTAVAGADVDAAENTPSAVGLVEDAVQALAPLADQDAELEEILGQLSDVSSLLTDAGNQMGIYAAGLDDSGPERLAQVHARRAELDRLMRLYGPEITDVLEWAAASRARLESLQGDESRIEQLTEEVQTLGSSLWQQAEALRTQRQQAGAALAEAVGEELAALAMPNARLAADVTATEALTRHGADQVAILLAPHAGADPAPLGRGASGGELSRVMLALEVVLSEHAPASTFIFDEVDAGVGGKAAVQIGRRLAKLARHAQVICVTHLPQVAAYADHHIRVFKDPEAAGQSDGVTASDVRSLTSQERVGELARMLAGQEDSASARAHADELLAQAARERPSAPDGSSRPAPER
ncbi:DNA repair protein RecN [Nesterenkonia populi]